MKQLDKDIESARHWLVSLAINTMRHGAPLQARAVDVHA